MGVCGVSTGLGAKEARVLSIVRALRNIGIPHGMNIAVVTASIILRLIITLCVARGISQGY
jgi:hypothetical protein